MRFWLHLVAAFTGFVVAAIIVVLVFRRADDEAAKQTTTAPGTKTVADAGGLTGAGGDCARLHPAQTTTAAARTAAAKHLPSLYDQRGVAGSPSNATQRAWVVRVQAALGDCTEEITVAPTSLRIAATFPADLSTLELDGYVFNGLTQAFSPGLARDAVDVEVARGAKSQRLHVRATAWRAFVRHHGDYRLPATIEGLRAYRAKTGLTRAEVTFVSWR